MLINVLTWTSLVMSAIAFLAFIFLCFRSTSKGDPSQAVADDRRRGSGISDITMLAEAVAKLAEGFAKAGPALSALVASILYLLVATLGAGLDKLSSR